MLIISQRHRTYEENEMIFIKVIFHVSDVIYLMEVQEAMMWGENIS